MNSLHGKSAAVTGAASEIGRTIATAFIDAGASVLLCDANYRAVEVLARQLGDRAIGRVVDVSDERQVAAALRAARATFGALDIVVHCAAFGAMAPPTGLTDEIAATALFLASEHAGSVNGKTFVIDAGSLTRGYPSPSLMRHGASYLLQLVNGAIARDWLRGLLMRANAQCEVH